MQREEVVGIIKQAKKVLFVLPMALGDFAYLHLVLREFIKMHPGITVDAMFDEALQGRLIQHNTRAVNPIICEWAADTGLFRDVYADLYTEEDVQAVVQRAQAEQYEVVISCAGRGLLQVAEVCRKTAPDALLIAWELESKWWQFGRDKRRYRKVVDLGIAPRIVSGEHVTEMYADFFRHFCDLPNVDWESRAEMTVPEAAQKRTEEWLAGRGIGPQSKVLFLNSFAKNRKRTWPPARLAELIIDLQANGFRDGVFLCNGLPQDQASIEEMIVQNNLTNSYFFTARDGFWDLPGMILRADLVVSVETSIMHLAALLHRPQVVLMRQKTPRWRPIRKKDCTVVLTPSRKAHIDSINVETVGKAVLRQWDERA